MAPCIVRCTQSQQIVADRTRTLLAHFAASKLLLAYDGLRPYTVLRDMVLMVLEAHGCACSAWRWVAAAAATAAATAALPRRAR